MRRFRDHVAYTYAGFTAYQENFAHQIEPFLPPGLAVPGRRMVA